MLPDDPGADPSALALDEDLVFVFCIEAGWVLVCETSVRLITGQDQGSRIDLADTVERAWWTGETLQIQDTHGTVTAINRDRSPPGRGTWPGARLMLIRNPSREDEHEYQYRPACDCRAGSRNPRNGGYHAAGPRSPADELPSALNERSGGRVTSRSTIQVSRATPTVAGPAQAAAAHYRETRS